MRQSCAVILLGLLATLLAPEAALAANRPGDYGFSTSIGFADTRNDNSYRSDGTFNFSFEYQKTGYAAYRGTAGFLSIQGRREISPAAGTRDADALFVTGDIVLSPRFAMVHPFLAAGVGFYNMRMTDRRTSDHSIELGVNWGFGIDVELVRHFAVRGEALFHYVTGSLSNPVQTLTVGGRFIF